jgi:gluconate 2-dehydrogenase gamma chain
MADQTEMIFEEPGEQGNGEQDGNAGAELTRREMIKLTAGAALAAPIVGLGDVRAAAASQNKAPLFFTREEFQLVDELTELIIPADDHSPGARAAEVAAYIDRRLSESFEEEPKRVWREGLKLIDSISQEMHGRALLQSTPDERIALLTRISQNEMKPQKPEESFFRQLKVATARAYYTSKTGIRTEMEYKGNSYLKEFVGYDAT